MTPTPKHNDFSLRMSSPNQSNKGITQTTIKKIQKSYKIKKLIEMEIKEMVNPTKSTI